MRNNKVRQKVKIDLYKKFVIQILLHNCKSQGISKQEQDKLSIIHQKRLHGVIVKQHPDRILNKKFYEKFRCKPMTIEIAK